MQISITSPWFNLREVNKQLVLLEDHLIHENKRCPDCIHKHFLWAEGLAEEGMMLDTGGEIPHFRDLSEALSSLFVAWSQGASPLWVAHQLRRMRKLSCAAWIEGYKKGQIQ